MKCVAWVSLGCCLKNKITQASLSSCCVSVTKSQMLGSNCGKTAASITIPMNSSDTQQSSALLQIQRGCNSKPNVSGALGQSPRNLTCPGVVSSQLVGLSLTCQVAVPWWEDKAGVRAPSLVLKTSPAVISTLSMNNTSLKVGFFLQEPFAQPWCQTIGHPENCTVSF